MASLDALRAAKACWSSGSDVGHGGGAPVRRARRAGDASPTSAAPTALGAALAELPRGRRARAGRARRGDVPGRATSSSCRPACRELPELAAARARGRGRSPASWSWPRASSRAHARRHHRHQRQVDHHHAVRRRSCSATGRAHLRGRQPGRSAGRGGGDARRPSRAASCVVEVSSFQLETVETLPPARRGAAQHHRRSPGSLPGHGRLRGGQGARLRRAEPSDDHAVVNLRRSAGASPPATASEPAGRLLGRRGTLHRRRRGSTGTRWPCACRAARARALPGDPPGLVGRHNQATRWRRCWPSRLAGATAAEARRALLAFRAAGAPHGAGRASASGVAYYDDSKGTNVGAVVAALDGLPAPRRADRGRARQGRRLRAAGRGAEARSAAPPC